MDCLLPKQDLMSFQNVFGLLGVGEYVLGEFVKMCLFGCFECVFG